MQEPASLKSRALHELLEVLHNNKQFIKAHAAEFLIWNGHVKEALAEYLQEEQKFANEPRYRIVIWRVLAQAEAEADRKATWLNKIYQAYTDPHGPDRLHATETLAKLHQPVAGLFPQVTAQLLQSADAVLQIFALWASCYGSEASLEQHVPQFLDQLLADNPKVPPRISAFILQQLKNLNEEQWQKLARKALAAQPASGNGAYVSLLSTALITAPSQAADLQSIYTNLLWHFKNYSLADRMELARVLAEKGSQQDLSLLEDMLNNKYCENIYDPQSAEAADLRASAAYAILKIINRN